MLTLFNHSRNLHRVLPAIAAAAGLPLAASAQSQAPTKADLSDEDIRDAITDDLFYSSAIDASNVEVTVSNGIATLEGETKTLLAKQRAIRTAQSIRGVTSVIDRVTVRPTAREDAKLVRDINTELATDPATESFEIRVTAEDGLVTLEGEVESGAEKFLAEHNAASIHGVTGIDNRIEVNPLPGRTDADIITDVNGMLEASVWIDSGLIHASVENGRVDLDGTVSSTAERLAAIRAAYVEGVSLVTADDLIVTPILPSDMKKWPADPAPIDDNTIDQSIETAMKLDPRVSSYAVYTGVDDGAVTLRGVVPTLSAKQAAETIARHTAGVERVRNNIRLDPQTETTDQRIAEALRKSLTRDATLSDQAVRVTVDDLIVSLDGTVATAHEKWHATSLAARIPGVIRVNNDLDTLYDWEWQTDAEIGEDIRDQLYWSPFVDSTDLTVSVTNGIATVSGTVDDYGELSAVRDNAFEGGAKDVRLALTYPSGNTAEGGVMTDAGN
ncbi:MAG: BON domain-containing protein [Phycisphaerales bacterium JB040]